MCMGCEIEARESFDRISDEINDGSTRDFTYLEVMDILTVAEMNVEGTVNGR